MARTINIDRARILDAALTLVRARGIEALSARALAAELGCSTQPLYRAFGSMEQLRVAVEERAVQRGLELFQDAQGTYLASGLGVLRMIMDEPHIFALITRDRATIEAMVSRAPPPRRSWPTCGGYRSWRAWTTSSSAGSTP